MTPAVFFRIFMFTVSILPTMAWAQGEASTYFNVFVPPNNDPVKRNVCLIVTAIFDDTSFEITDDGMDGDTDDSKSGVLSRGQSYVLYIADNGINDDARYASGGVWKQDGDYFIIRSNKNILVSQSTNSDWQHDFVPSIGQKGIGERFFVYAPQITSSKRDLNTFVYEDSTLVTIKRISTSPTTITGLTNIDYENAVVVGSQLLNRGQDIIYFSALGRNVMETGHTYIVESSKPITLQYGALSGNERDGGGNVPSSNGSSAGELFYFAVPYQSGGEQEIRIVSWDDSNSVKLERYNAGAWVAVKTWSLNKYGFSDWVGKSNGNVSYPTIFRITATEGKKVSVFEANWLETGNPGTSDIGTMLTSENGTSAGKKFIAYMAPPGNEQNVRDPFTGTLVGQQLTHLYISSRTGAQVTVKDAFTNGVDFSRTYSIAPERYVDCSLTLQEWKNIYNGTGTTTGGPERPYLIVESDQPISIFNTNFNDNWMAYLGTAQTQDFSLKTEASSSVVIPGDSSLITTQVVLNTTLPVTNGNATLQVEGNIRIVSSVFNDATGSIQTGQISGDAQSVTFTNLPTLTSNDAYSFGTVIVTSVAGSNGDLYLGKTVGTLTAELTGTTGGNSLQAVSSNGIFVNSEDQSQLLFSQSNDATWSNLLTNSWAVNLIDYNNDNWDDIFIAENDNAKPNYLFRNNGNKTFTKIATGALVSDLASSISASWADVDNDGDIDVIIANNTQKPNSFFLNDGNGSFTKNNTPGFVQQPAYYHNATWVDYDSDGLLDLFLCNYWPTKFNELWHNDGNGKFSLQENSALSQNVGTAASVTWADYDNDGLMDVFVPNNKDGKNDLFHNDGNGKFTKASNVISNEGGFSVASCWGDVDGNGFLDLFVANASNKNNFLYLNVDGTTFQKVVAGAVVSEGGHSHGCSFADVDNDGDLDLYVTNDTNDKFLYINNGLGQFTRRTNEVITADYGKSMGHAWSDLDKDGDLDLFSVTHSNERNHMFWNNGNSNHWLQLKLNGTTSNRSAIGSRVRIKCNNKWQTREVVSQSGIGGQSSYRNHFGLGNAVQVDSMVIHWPSGIIQVLTNVPSNQYMIVTEEEGSVLEGKIYADKNNNCIKDTDENYLSGQVVKILPQGIRLFTDGSGSFRVNVAPGNYTLEFTNTSSYQYACSGQTMVVNVAAGKQKVSLAEIPAKPLCNCSDARVSGYTTALRRGFGDNYFVEVANEGTLPMDGVEVKVSVPHGLDFKHAIPAWTSHTQVGSTMQYKWSLGQLTPGEIKTITVRDSISLTLQVGDLVVVSAQVTTTSPESDLSDNVVSNQYEVVGAIDPNMIVATPRGYGEERFLEVTQEITYQIHFENFGNHPTSFVTVTDTLPDAFAAESLYDIQATHSPLQTRVEGNIVTFHFPSIQLSPAEVDSVQSKGFVQFKIRALSHGSGLVRNRASIVFDYNEPIVTNSVMHTLFSKQGVSSGTLAIFPNPATAGAANLYVNSTDEDSSEMTELVLIDTRGVIQRRIPLADSFYTVDLAGLNNGLYIVRASARDGKLYYGKLIIER